MAANNHFYLLMALGVSSLGWAQKGSSAGNVWVHWWVRWDEGVSNVSCHIYGISMVLCMLSHPPGG